MLVSVLVEDVYLLRFFEYMSHNRLTTDLHGVVFTVKKILRWNVAPSRAKSLATNKEHRIRQIGSMREPPQDRKTA